MLKQNLRYAVAPAGKKNTALANLAFVLAALLLFLGATPGRAQTITAASGLDGGFRSMYNLQFEQAHRAFADWQGLHPDDPMGPAAEAAVFLFSECDRLHILEMQFLPDDKKAHKSSELTPDPETRKQFEAMLEKARAMAEARLAQDPRDTNAMFARLFMEGLHGDYLALVANRERDALGYFKQSRVLAEGLIAIDPANYDAYLPIGVENYMTSLKGGFTRWILRAGGAQTDKATGLKNLKIVAEKGHYLAPFARVFLAIAALHDHDNAHAVELMEDLAREFPGNSLYIRELALLRSEAGSHIAEAAGP
jgi:hypothetical protein